MSEKTVQNIDGILYTLFKNGTASVGMGKKLIPKQLIRVILLMDKKLQ